MAEKLNLEGRKFGCLTVLFPAAAHISLSGAKATRWIYECDLGTYSTPQEAVLSRNKFIEDEHLSYELKIQKVREEP